MISLALAKLLKDAGLLWKASTNDFFVVPDRGMDERIFVLADLQAQLDVFRGWPVVTFHGTAEWALDYILTSEVIWIPREDQLLEAIHTLLPTDDSAQLTLQFKVRRIICSFLLDGESRHYHASSPGEAYAKALLFLLNNQQPT